MGQAERTRATPSSAPKASDGERASFYRAALLALRYVEHRRPTGRRFGPEADARWSAMKGHLLTTDRIDLLLRDADREWLHAFGPRMVFHLGGLADDEPFGAEWSPVDPVAAEELWRSVLASPAPTDARAAAEAIARSWDLELSPAPASVTPSDKLLVAGPNAIAAAISAFAGASVLDWADQVIVLASPPAHRQLAALGAALVNATKGTVLVSPDTPDTHDKHDGKKIALGRRVLVSADVASEDAAFLESLDVRFDAASEAPSDAGSDAASEAPSDAGSDAASEAPSDAAAARERRR